MAPLLAANIPWNIWGAFCQQALIDLKSAFDSNFDKSLNAPL
jgi:hypothetical protein